MGGVRTKELLESALAKAESLGLNIKPNVLVDSGSENVNEVVIEGLVKSDLISMTIAQIDIEESNSMVEMLFQRMKHLYLYTMVLCVTELFAGVMSLERSEPALKRNECPAFY